MLILADSRRGLSGFPPFCWKMNRTELGKLLGEAAPADVDRTIGWAKYIAERNGRMVFITLAEEGMAAAMPDGTAIHVPARPIRGEIDVVGAGDAVLASLAAALAAGASPEESLELASAAASVVIHQLGTTGAATVAQIAEVLGRGEILAVQSFGISGGFLPWPPHAIEPLSFVVVCVSPPVCR